MSINITDEITAEYEKYMREVIDYGFTGTPITRLDVGYHESIVTFAAGYQVANTKQAARLAELEAQLSDLDKLKLDIENTLKAIAEYDQENTDLKAQLAAVQADAELYYWLRDRMQVRYEKPISDGKERQTLSMRHGFSFTDSTISPASGWLDLKSFDKCRAKVDETIRAAIAGEET